VTSTFELGLGFWVEDPIVHTLYRRKTHTHAGPIARPGPLKVHFVVDKITKRTKPISKYPFRVSVREGSYVANDKSVVEGFI